VRRALPLALSLLTVLNLPATAAARPLAREPDDRPWGRGTLMPSFGLGGGFSRGGGGSLLVGGGLTYFVVNNLGLGLSLRNYTTFLSSTTKALYPGIDKQIPTNEFSLIPGLTVVLYRSYRFSPYISGGVGPVFLNHKRGVVGEWNAGPGVLIGLGRMAALNLGINFSSMFPSARCDDAYRYGSGAAAIVFNSCGLRWGIQGGLVFGFGVGRKRNNPQPPPPGATYVPPPDPAPEPYPAPIPPPASEPAVAPVPTAEPTTAEPLAPTTTTPPPGESVPAAPPPGESVPVAPLPDE